MGSQKLQSTRFLLDHFALEDEQLLDFVRQTIIDAIAKKASDVHIEPYATAYRIRLRVDGILHEVGKLSGDLASRIITHLKVISKLDIAERRLPQDGRFSFQMDDKKTLDCRINVCPTIHGEKTVIRILVASHTSLLIEDLGLGDEQKQLFEWAIQRPQGMLLVTGPTGSGKTVTLYSILNYLNVLEKNICTVEDPVEIQLLGINQVNIYPKINLSFPCVLRALLRQDPDILMVGEIRDQETAEIAIKAAQTGHLVLSTLHTNNAVESITRLITLGLSAYSLAGNIHLIIAQRLLRKLCNHCKRAAIFTHDFLDQLNLSLSAGEKNLIFQPVGCEHCMGGYKGRTAVFELLPILDHFAHLIITQADSLTLFQQARQMGMITLREAAMKKVFSGITSLEEVARVI